MTRRTIGIDDLPGLAGEQLGASAWHTVTQAAVDTFAEATGDRQWIHVDHARAAAGPFGGTIAHGYLTLALAPEFLDEIVEVDGVSLVLNYGLNRVRFPAPVPVGSRVRVRAEVVSAEPIPNGVQVVLGLTVELEGGMKPACVAEVVFRYLR